MNSCVLGDAIFDVSSSQLGREMLARTWVSLLSIFAIPKGVESKSVWRFLCGWFFVKGAVPLLLNGTANRRSFPVFFDVEPLIRLVAPIPELLFLKDGSKHSEGSWFERRRFAPRPLEKND